MNISNSTFAILAPRGEGRGFTLVELLVVIGIMAILTALAAPSLVSLQGNYNLSGAAYALNGTLEQARAEAMGDDTHVFVGIAEYDASQSPNTSPQPPGIGRVVISAVASRDGTSIYDINNLSSWVSNYNNGTSLVAVLKPQIFENIHLADDTLTPPTTGTMARPSVPESYRVGNSSFTSSTTFSYPLNTGSPRFSFTKVIDFDPHGTARVINSADGDAIPSVIEIDLQQTHGVTIPSTPSDSNPLNYIAIQCDGMTGATQIFQ